MPHALYPLLPRARGIWGGGILRPERWVTVPDATARALFNNDDIVAQISTFLDDPQDLIHLEEALQRPVAGLFANVGEGALRRAVSPPFSWLGAPNFALRAGPDAVYRQLLAAGLPAAEVQRLPDAKLVAMAQALLPSPLGLLPLAQQLRAELQQRRQALLLPVWQQARGTLQETIDRLQNASKASFRASEIRARLQMFRAAIQPAQLHLFDAHALLAPQLRAWPSLCLDDALGTPAGRTKLAISLATLKAEVDGWVAPPDDD